MKGKSSKQKSMEAEYRFPHTLGFASLKSISDRLQDARAEFEKETDWLYELLAECRKTFAKPEVKLLPKTPSQKRTGRQKRPAKFSDSDDASEKPPVKRLSFQPDEGGDADTEDVISPKPRRTRAASRQATTGRPKRNTRNNKTVKITEKPIMSMTQNSEDSKTSQVRTSDTNQMDVDATPVNKATTSLTSEERTPKVSEVDESIDETPKAVNKEDEIIIKETPETNTSFPKTPNTVIRKPDDDIDTPVNCAVKQTENDTNTPLNHNDNDTPESCVDTPANCDNKQADVEILDSSVEETCVSPKKDNSRASVRKSLRHSRQSMSFSRRSTMTKRQSVLRKNLTNEQDSMNRSVPRVETPEKKPTRPRTRMRLQKKSQNTDSVSSDRSVCTASSQSSITDDDSTENEQPKRTRTKTRKALAEAAKASQDSQSTEKSSEDYSDDEVMLIDQSPLKETETSDKSQGPRTRTRQKTQSKTESEDDSGITSMSEVGVPRTRSKMRQPKESQVQIDSNGHFVKPDQPAPAKKNGKRALSDDEADMSISKKSCMDHSDMSDISVGVPLGSSTRLSTKSNECKSTDDESPSGSDYDSPVCPKDKVVRPKPQVPSFKHNLSNKIVVQNKPGIIRSFITRNSPVKKLTAKELQEQRKKEFLEKEKKEQERLQRRQIEMQQRIEESRRKNEEKMKRINEAKDQKAKREQEMKDRVQRKMEEKRIMTEKQKEEKAKEEARIRQMKIKKHQEIEERRKKEEEEQQQKILKQEEENRLMIEAAEKKKEIEEQKRLQKIAEDNKKYEEKLAALAKERQEEQESLRKKEEEKLLEQQKIREQREKQMALEKAEREKKAIEEKKQKDQLLKERMAKIKELEKKRLLEEEKRRAELREHEEAVKQIISHHNTSLQNTKEEIYKTAMKAAGLNTTQTYSSKPHNPDSYDMTPAKSYRQPFDTYDITDLKSDDSTDDEDAPKKRIPPWASGPNLKAALINQHYHPPDLERMFDEIIPPDLNEIFIKKKARFNKRTSSAHWTSPILRPGSVVLHW